MNAPVYRSRLIEVQIPGGAAVSAEFNFPDQPDLRSAMVTGVETFSGADTAFGPSGVPTITAVDGTRVVVTLSDGSDEKVKNVPYQSFNRALNAGMFRDYRNLTLTYQNCRLRLTGPLSTAPCVALVLVHFFYPGDVK